jgi:hypothetical protein
VLLLAAPLICYTLGAVIEAALGDARADDWAPAALFRRLALGLLLAAWLGVTLAQLGHFSLAALGLALGACSVPPLIQVGRSGAWSGIWQLGRWRRPAELLALATLLGLAVSLFTPPGEDVLGARDPGIYFASGVAIARGGDIIQDDPALAALGEALGNTSVNYWLFQSVHGWPLRFPGQLFVRDLSNGTVEPGFLPWYPVAIAAVVAAGGLDVGLWLNPALATLAVVAIFLAGRLLLGPTAAALGAGLLVVNLAQVWFARSTMAEPATQLIVWSGIYALAAADRRPTLSLGALAGLAWASALLVRVEAVLLVPIAAVYLIRQARRPSRPTGPRFALVLVAVGALQSLAHARWLAPAYTGMVFSERTLAVAAGGVALVLLLLALAWLLLAWWHPPDPRWRTAAIAGLLLIGLSFAYAARPALPAPTLPAEAAELEIAARESLVRLGWYLSPLGLMLAAVGTVGTLVSGRWRGALLLLALLGLSVAFYLPNPLVSSDHPWAARRYLPVVLPAVLLLVGYGAVWLGRLPGRRDIRIRRLAPALAAALAILVAAGEWHATAPIVGYREHQDAVAQVLALAALTPPEAIVLFPRSNAGMRLSLPLQYLGNRRAFVLPTEGPEEGVVGVIQQWIARGQPVYWVVPLGTRFPTPPGLRFAPAGQYTFEAPQLDRPVDRLPTAATPLRFDLQLYRVEAAPS